ncbi:hypothetical protein MPTK1_7g13900 [Marchantia polymorpha subsp. ruderalis]|uniref:Uncharacterized protein n=2 Tax=Marchantia polymorpha TaxID=3197 RepID=A0AAF6BZC5_MARPO|nr:hypothetical protein MARPO_0009s0075 [Marchantia polymorpha]BBN17359.1 hypothetical protein Mp_7g13900 [Marchantia polymorpha subsp. ruderalis]|eukprot:PTQ46963.1 hypothetical protein MARPO_0009s0075 [Marchantia polymorpha]
MGGRQNFMSAEAVARSKSSSSCLQKHRPTERISWLIILLNMFVLHGCETLRVLIMGN